MVYPADETRIRLSLLRREIEGALAIVAVLAEEARGGGAHSPIVAAEPGSAPARVRSGDTRERIRAVKICAPVLLARSRELRSRADAILARARVLRGTSTDLLRSHPKRGRKGVLLGWDG